MNRVLTVILLGALTFSLGLDIFNGMLLQRLTGERAEVEATLDRLNKRAGCDGTEPKIVPYHEGMTLCPGQEAIGPLIIIPSLPDWRLCDPKSALPWFRCPAARNPNDL